MKKVTYILGGLAFLIAANSYGLNYEPGPYLGGQIGWGRIDAGDGYSAYATKEEDLGKFTAWRAYAGYSFNPVFSMEGGYSYYPQNEYTGEDKVNIKSYTIDIVGKLIFPLEKLGKSFAHFSIYGKAGAAYINTKAEIGAAKTNSSDTISPTYGAGIIFNFTDNIAVDASWTGVMGRHYVNSQGEALTKNPVANCNMFTLGISYKITGIF